METTFVPSGVYGPKKSKRGKDFWTVKDGDDAFFVWEKTQSELAQQAMDNGQSIKIVWEADGDFKKVEEVAGPIASNGDGPKPVTHVRKSDDLDLLGKAVNNALAQAVEATRGTLRADMTPKDISSRVEPLASSFVFWAKQELGFQVTEDDVPF